MPDYKEMYLKMVRATEKAINILIQAQQECEEDYLNAPAVPTLLHPSDPDSGQQGDFS